MVADDQMNNQSDTLFASRIPDASAAVIAGGNSSRFGSPKAAAILMDRQLIDYSIQAGYRISNEVFLVTADTVPFNNPFAPAIVDIYPDEMEIKFYAWRQPEPVSAIDDLKPHHVVKLKRQ